MLSYIPTENYCNHRVEWCLTILCFIPYFESNLLFIQQHFISSMSKVLLVVKRNDYAMIMLQYWVISQMDWLDLEVAEPQITWGLHILLIIAIEVLISKLSWSYYLPNAFVAMGQIIKSVCLSVCVCVTQTSWMLYRSQYSTGLYQTRYAYTGLVALNKNMQIRPVGVVAGVTWLICKFWVPLYLRNGWSYTIQILHACRGLCPQIKIYKSGQ